MKTAYVAGKFGFANAVEVQRIQELLLDECGLECEFDWTHEIVTGPEDGPWLASKEIGAAQEADVFVLLWHPNLLGGLIELGAAIAANRLYGGAPTVFVYAPKRSSIFWDLPRVKIVDDDAELVREVKKCL